MSTSVLAHQKTNSANGFEQEDRQTRELVRDLHEPNPVVYWTDLLFTAILGWTAFAGAVALRPFSWGMVCCALVAVAALYRGLCFMHELSHLRRKSLPGFETAWNILFGYPLLMPSFTYVGMHQSHHKLSTYGTAQDPEYMPFAQSSRMTVVFALESFFIPIALVIRFLLLATVGLLVPKFHKWLAVYASSLTMNLKYRREATPELLQKIRVHSIALQVLWNTIFALFIFRVLPVRTIFVGLAIYSLISFINTLRTLGAHDYESTGEPLDRTGQLLDSIDTPGGWWTELWAPVGLRYHALHHYFPGMPYHNLAKAYRLLTEQLPAESLYHQAMSSSLRRSLSDLYRKGRSLPQS